MRKIFLVLLVIATACTSQATRTSTPSPTPTRFVLPTPIETAIPTRTPFVITQTPSLIEKLIVVKLDEQKTYVYENGQLIREFLVSTGTKLHPTVQGKFHIEAKFESTEMTDYVTYDLKNVPWVMYFGNDEVSWHEGYSFHGTYWHNNFGHPMSHGCVNMRTEDAKWLKVLEFKTRRFPLIF